MRQLIELAVKTIYTENFEIESLLPQMSKMDDHVAVMRAYIAIRAAMRLTEPLCDADVDEAVMQLDAAERQIGTADDDSIHSLLKGVAELYWMRRHTAILRGKLAQRDDEDSYEGVIYASCRAKEGPISLEEKEAVKRLVTQLADLKLQIEELELKALKDSDIEEYERYSDELECQVLQREVDAHEFAEQEAEFEEMIAPLEQKLDGLLATQA